MNAYFGLRAHDFGTKPSNELAPHIGSSGARCVQLALAKALPGNHLFPSSIGPEGLAAITQDFSQQDTKIAVLGCYIDMVTADHADRENSFKRFEEHIDIAQSMGCNIVGTETGSPFPFIQQDALHGRENAYQEAMKGISRLVRYAEKTWPNGVYVGMEPVADFHSLSTIDHVKRMIEALNSPALGIIFDPVNLIPIDGVESMDDFLDECFATFGDRIVAIHVKDYVMEETLEGKRKSAALLAGLGEMDWVGLFKRLIIAGKANVPILLEEAGPADAEAAFARMKQAWDTAAASVVK